MPAPARSGTSDPDSSVDPLVSVVLISYNHQEFIGQALQSILDQETDWPMEFIVADDGSTDSTPEIIREFATKHPGRITPVLRASNTGIHANLVDALSRTRGKYVALCEGDDYWTDPEKLRRQISHLEEHPDVSVCFHPVRGVWDDDSSRPDYIDPPEDAARDLSLNALLAANFMQTNSVVYRRLPSYDDIPDVIPLDWLLHIRHAQHGRIAMLPQVMAVYRRHAGGAWYGYEHDPTNFWLKVGVRHLAFFETLLNDFRDEPERQEHIVHSAAKVLEQLLLHGLSDADPPLLLRLIAAYPTWAKLALARLSDEFHGQRRDLVRLRTEVGTLRQRVDREKEKTRRQRARAERAERRIEQMVRSRTWRVGRAFIAPIAIGRRRSK